MDFEKIESIDGLYTVACKLDDSILEQFECMPKGMTIVLNVSDKVIEELHKELKDFHFNKKEFCTTKYFSPAGMSLLLKYTPNNE